MAILSYASYKSKVAVPSQRMQDTKVSMATVARRLHSYWTVAPDAGVAPTTAAVPTRATLGAIGQANGGAQALRLISAPVSLSTSGCIILCDRLSHQGGLSGTATGAQTTNLPTAALTRYTSGVGVYAALEIYTVIGTGAQTVTMSYTNSAGSSGQISPPTVFGSAGFREANRFIVLPLAAGDVGVQAVANITISASTGTVGNFGVTLFKPLFIMPIVTNGSQQFAFDPVLTSCANLPEIMDDACLFYLFMANTTTSGVLCNTLRFAEDDP